MLTITTRYFFLFCRRNARAYVEAFWCTVVLVLHTFIRHIHGSETCCAEVSILYGKKDDDDSRLSK